MLTGWDEEPAQYITKIYEYLYGDQEIGLYQTARVYGW